MGTERSERPESDLPTNLGRPATRALASAGYTNLAQLTSCSEAEILKLHGMGPAGVARLHQALAEAGLAFKKPDQKYVDEEELSLATTTAVTTFIAQTDHPLKAEIEALRGLIRGADQRIQESIKWNAPSFAITEHFATFKLRPQATIQIILHTGAKKRTPSLTMAIRDQAGLVKWLAPDRGIVTFSDLPDITAKATAFVDVVRQWVGQLEGESGS